MSFFRYFKNASISTVLCCALFGPVGHPAAAQAPVEPLVFVPRAARLPNGSTTKAFAAHPNGRRIYLGRFPSYDVKRTGLIVVTLDENGKPVGRARYYLESTEPLPDKAHSNIPLIYLSPDARKLFYVANVNSPKPLGQNKMLKVYDLDAAGDPVGRPREYHSGNPYDAVNSIVRHPKLPLLYIGGYGGGDIYAYALDKNGEPIGKPTSLPLGGGGQFEIRLSRDARKIYLGTQRDKLMVLDLDENGMAVGAARSYIVGTEDRYLQFAYTPQAIYYLVGENTPQKRQLGYWRLDASGEPIGTPQILASPNITAIAADEKGNAWVAVQSTLEDALTKQVFVSGTYAARIELPLTGAPILKQSGDLQQWIGTTTIGFAPGISRPIFVNQAIARFHVNRFANLFIRATTLDMEFRNGTKPEIIPCLLQSETPPKNFPQHSLRLGESTPWTNLNDLLKERAGQSLVSFSAGNMYALPGDGSATARLKVKFEIAEGDPAEGGKILKQATDEVEGPSVGILVPCYITDTPEKRVEAIELLSEHAKKYLAAAQARGVAPEDRPRLFTIGGNHFMGGQGSRKQLELSAETIAQLGINTVNPYVWGGIDLNEVDKVLDAKGVTGRSRAVYNPPSYFHFAHDKMNPQALAKWLGETAHEKNKWANPREDKVIDFKLSDEPGWHATLEMQLLKSKPEYLAVFHDFLKEKKFAPEFFGKTQWSQVLPIGTSGATDLPSRRLFYWTMRFLTVSATRGHKLAQEALRRFYPNLKTVDVNWNNWSSRIYTPQPSPPVDGNFATGPDVAIGSFDWFESGRDSAHTLWTEDWVGDSDSHHWSYYGDFVASAAALGNSSMGGYIVGGSTGSHPSGASLKALAYIAKGAKTLDFYTWGTAFLFGDCWSDNWRSYPVIADATRRIGRAERLLYPGKRARGKVAVAVPLSAHLWEKVDEIRHYSQSEMLGLHAALVHAGYTVEFVSEDDLRTPDWKTQGYSTLYITAPNIAASAQIQIASWVEGGGTLVAMPGAGVADEYNTPTETLGKVLGLGARTAVREKAAPMDDNMEPSAEVTMQDERFGSGKFTLLGPTVDLEPQGAKTLASFSGGPAQGGSALAAATYGKGRAISYGFYPGWQYWNSPNRTDYTRLPRDWSTPLRKMAVAPAVIAKTPKAVTLDREVVEAARLQSEKGIAIVLLNWLDEPQKEITVTVPNTGAWKKVSSIEGAAVQSTPAGDGLKITLPLKSVDVLMIE